MNLKKNDLELNSVAMRRRSRAVDAAIEAFMARANAKLAQEAGPAKVLGFLNQGETSSFWASQERFLRDLIDHRGTRDEMDKYARRLGYAHAMVGVKPSWVLGMIPLFGELFHEVVKAIQFAPCESDLTLNAMSERLGAALRAMVYVDESIDDLLADCIDEVNAAISAATTSVDLICSTIAAIQAFAGVASVAYGRADGKGNLLYEYFEGAEFARYLELVTSGAAAAMTSLPGAATGHGPSGRAWRSGQIQHSSSFSTDPTMAPWQQVAERLGLRSLLALPILNSTGDSIGVVNIYSKWPGYFAPHKRYRAFAYIQQAMSAALVQLDAGPVVPASQRDKFREMLRGDSLEMHFQPIVDLRSGNIVKLEALARLRGHAGVLITPAQFMGAFGSEDLYVLFQRGLAISIAVLERLESQGIKTDVSVNLPTQGTKDQRYYEAVALALASSSVAAERLTLELTEEGKLSETTLDEAPELCRMRSLGVLIAQDDLGAGYSSLLRLERFGFHDVKIDQELIRGAGDARNALDLIQHLTGLAHDLGIGVVVEGLEGPALLEAAAIMGADYGQGYGIARPMPESEIAAFFADFRWSTDVTSPVTALGALAAMRRWSRQLLAMGNYGNLIESSMPIDELKHLLRGFPELDLEGHFSRHYHGSAAARALSLAELEEKLSGLFASEPRPVRGASHPERRRDPNKGDRSRLWETTERCPQRLL